VVAQLSSLGSVNLTGTFGTTFHSALQPSGGVTPYSFAFDPTGLPPWLSIDRATGVISGTPDLQCSTTTPSGTLPSEQFACDSASFIEHATVTDAIGETFPVTVNLVVTAPPLVVDHNASVTQTTGSALDVSVGTVHGGYGSGTLTYTASNLPCNLAKTVCDQIDFSTGRITGTLADFGSPQYDVLVTVTEDDPTPGSSNTFVAQYHLTINAVNASPSASPGASP
jgi:hypothetical protein